LLANHARALSRLEPILKPFPDLLLI
jgi:hypothetical protein